MPTRFRRKLVVWLGFEAQKGAVYLSKKAPENFVESESKHISRDDAGYLCFERNEAYSEGRMAFKLAEKVGQVDYSRQIEATQPDQQELIRA